MTTRFQSVWDSKVRWRSSGRIASRGLALLEHLHEAAERQQADAVLRLFPSYFQDLRPEADGKRQHLHPEQLREGEVTEFVDEDEDADEEDEVEEIQGPGPRDLPAVARAVKSPGKLRLATGNPAGAAEPLDLSRWSCRYPTWTTNENDEPTITRTPARAARHRRRGPGQVPARPRARQRRHGTHLRRAAHDARLARRAEVPCTRISRSDPIAVERFAREARAAAMLRSPHVARILDVDALPSGELYIVMEYLEGTSLETVAQSGARLPIAEAVSSSCRLRRARRGARARDHPP